jgi:hypothetical protein
MRGMSRPDWRRRIFLAKSRKVRYKFLLIESSLLPPCAGIEGKRGMLFETLPHNLRGEPGSRKIFLFFSAVTH